MMYTLSVKKTVNNDINKKNAIIISKNGIKLLLGETIVDDNR